MKSNWKDMSKKEKALFFVYCILAIIGVVAAVADVSSKWAHADLIWMITVAIVLAIECTQNWNKNRKYAILEAIGGVIMLVCGIAGKFI